MKSYNEERYWEFQTDENLYYFTAPNMPRAEQKANDLVEENNEFDSDIMSLREITKETYDEKTKD